MKRWTWAIVGVTGGLLLLWVTGALRHTNDGSGHDAGTVPPPSATSRAERVTVPVVEDAVGTVESRQRVAVAAQTMARILEVGPRVGDPVRTGQLLVRLDDAEVAARFARAQAQYERLRRFVAAKAATTEQLETVEAEYRQAKAGLDHTRIVAPLDGVVGERQAEPGDLAMPGRPLLVVYDPTALRIEARVREGTVGRLTVGMSLAATVPAVTRTFDGIVSTVVPIADPASRTFEVRLDLPTDPGLHPGMFARLHVPIDTREVVRVPASAVVRTGQIETVLVRDGDRWRRRLITTGGALPDGATEVLSGLDGTETIGLPSPDARP